MFVAVYTDRRLYVETPVNKMGDTKFTYYCDRNISTYDPRTRSIFNLATLQVDSLNFKLRHSVSTYPSSIN